MPKKIENLKDMILQDARIILKKQGYEQLAIRKVANDCHIAVGTVYNYFPSKEMLAAYVMLEDWQVEGMHSLLGRRLGLWTTM